MNPPSYPADITNLPFIPMRNQNMAGHGHGHAHGHLRVAQQAQKHYDQYHQQAAEQQLQEQRLQYQLNHQQQQHQLNQHQQQQQLMSYLQKQRAYAQQQQQLKMQQSQQMQMQQQQQLAQAAFITANSTHSHSHGHSHATIGSLSKANMLYAAQGHAGYGAQMSAGMSANLNSNLNVSFKQPQHTHKGQLRPHNHAHALQSQQIMPPQHSAPSSTHSGVINVQPQPQLNARRSGSSRTRADGQFIDPRQNATRTMPSPRSPATERYATLKQVGQGTFADIWEVYASDCRGHFALKALRKGKCLAANGKLDASKYRRYSNAILAEGKRIARLNERDPECRAQLVRCREVLLPREISPNLAAALAGTDGQNPIGPCVVLELLGVSLIHFEHMRKRKKVAISLQTVRYIAVQLLNAMSFLHGVGGYIHADLKPENVVISLEHSVNGQLLSNSHPTIKVVDLGNALAVGREVSTFEVQSLHYRAPELIFGNEVTAAIDLWSVGCILLELVSDHQYCRGLEAAKEAQLDRLVRIQTSQSRSTSNPKSSKDVRRQLMRSLCHYAVFASRNNAQLASRIVAVLSSLPAYFYNEFASFHWTPMSAAYPSAHPSDFLLGSSSSSTPLPLTHCDADYSRLRLARRQRLIDRMLPDTTARAKLDRDTEFVDFLDLIARLLDPNPATRFTSEDATQHRFCIGIDYVRHDEKLHEVLRHKFDSAFPRVTISSDADRQRRLDAQLQCYQQLCEAAANGEITPRPTGKAVTRRTSHSDVQCSDPSVRHSRAVCLVRGCCGNATLPPLQPIDVVGANGINLEYASVSPLTPSLSAQPGVPGPPPNKRIKLFHAPCAQPHQEHRGRDLTDI